jgi:hypothetical protein
MRSLKLIADSATLLLCTFLLIYAISVKDINRPQPRWVKILWCLLFVGMLGRALYDLLG